MNAKRLETINVMTAYTEAWAVDYKIKVAKYGEPLAAIYIRQLLEATHRGKEVEKAHSVFIRSQSPVIVHDGKLIDRKLYESLPKDTVYPIHICAYCNQQKEAGVICPCQEDAGDTGEDAGDTGEDAAGDTGDDHMEWCWQCNSWYCTFYPHICVPKKERHG